MDDIPKEHADVLRLFEEQSGLKGLETTSVPRADSPILKILVANPTDRLFQILEEAKAMAAGSAEELPLVTLARKSSGNLLERPEGQIFGRTLSESLNINRYSFARDFMARYTRSVGGAETHIAAAANHIVYGRRGAGKSMLLLYSLHDRQQAGHKSLWLDLQVYAQREDEGTISDILVDLLDQASALAQNTDAVRAEVRELKKPTTGESKIRRLLPNIRRYLGQFSRTGKTLFVFLDDFHVLSRSLQPRVLDVLYAIARGNQVFLKLSAIESLTQTFDSEQRVGLQIPHDAQVIKLDYNLTVPDKAIQHIEAILEAQAIYAGLPSIRRICTSINVLPRLTWVAAGVPRDALYLFSQAMIKAVQAGRQRVSVSDVNRTASETLTVKLKEFESDVGETGYETLNGCIGRVRSFCVTDNRKNAFLIEIRSDEETYKNVCALVDLRLLHVINEGVTIGEAGRKYLALILDYGFYTGIRAAQSVDLFNQQSTTVKYRELRKLPVFRI